jgi:hypothetical protein
VSFSSKESFLGRDVHVVYPLVTRAVPCPVVKKTFLSRAHRADHNSLIHTVLIRRAAVIATMNSAKSRNSESYRQYACGLVYKSECSRHISIHASLNASISILPTVSERMKGWTFYRPRCLSSFSMSTLVNDSELDSTRHGSETAKFLRECVRQRLQQPQEQSIQCYDCRQSVSDKFGQLVPAQCTQLQLASIVSILSAIRS